MEHNNKKRILIFSTAYYPYVGGAEVAIKEITDRLYTDYNFDLITARFERKLPAVEKVGFVTVYRIGFGNNLFDKLWLPFGGFIKIWKLSRDNDYDAFWGMMVTFSGLAAYIYNLVAAVLRKKHVPVVTSLQEGDSENHLKYRWGGLIALSWKLAMWQTDYITGLSNFLLDRAVKNGYKGDMCIVPNGVDIKVFSRDVDIKVKDNLIREFDKKLDDVYVVTWSRLTHKNAIDDVINAISHLPKNISLIIMGVGEEGQKLQKLVNDLNLQSRVKFLGFVPHNKIPDYLSVCDIFIRPSRSEGFGNSFIEAMAARLPVIATPVGGIPDFIDDNETGIFCAPNNPQSIVKSINLIIENKSLREKIVNNAFNRVNERYSWENVSGQMKRVFDKAIG